MKKQASIMVFGQKVKIKYVKGLMEKSDINGDYGAGIIRLDSELSDKMLYLTLLHEAVHALFDRCGLNQAVDSGVEEIICDNIAMLIYENYELTEKRPRRKARPSPKVACD